MLELKSTAQKKMKSEMTSYIQTYNQDPTSLNSDDTDSGVWFNITRQGVGRDTEYDVKIVQSKIKAASGKITFEDDRSPLADSIVENYDNLAYDLGGVYQVKTYDQLAEILEANMEDLVKLCPDADLNAFERVVLAPSKTEVVATKTTGTKPVTLKMDDADEEEAVEVVVTKTATKATVKAKATDEDDFMAAADALLNS